MRGWWDALYVSLGSALFAAVIVVLSLMVGVLVLAALQWLGEGGPKRWGRRVIRNAKIRHYRKRVLRARRLTAEATTVPLSRRKLERRVRANERVLHSVDRWMAQ